MFITNRLALWLTYLILPTKITPNQVTLASLCMALACGLLFAFGHFIVGALCLFASHVLDCTDGNLARAKQLFSPYGKLLDMAADRLGESAIFVGLAFYYWPQQQEWAALSLLLGLLLLLYYYIVDIALTLLPRATESKAAVPSRWVIDGVRLKWGLMEPVIYGFIFFAVIGRIEWQLTLLLPLVLFGLGLQWFKLGRLIRNG